MNEQSWSAPGLEEKGNPGTLRLESRDDSRNSQRVRVRGQVQLQAVANGWFCTELHIFQPVLFLFLCASSISPFINIIQAAKSATVCVRPRPNTALLSLLAVRNTCLIRTHCTSTKPLRFQEPWVLSLLLWIQHWKSKSITVHKHLVLSAHALLTRLGSPATLFILHSLKLNLEMKATLLPSGENRETPHCNKPWGGINSI